MVRSLSVTGQQHTWLQKQETSFGGQWAATMDKLCSICFHMCDKNCLEGAEVTQNSKWLGPSEIALLSCFTWPTKKHNNNLKCWLEHSPSWASKSMCKSRKTCFISMSRPLQTMISCAQLKNASRPQHWALVEDGIHKWVNTSVLVKSEGEPCPSMPNVANASPSQVHPRITQDFDSMC